MHNVTAKHGLLRSWLEDEVQNTLPIIYFLCIHQYILFIMDLYGFNVKFQKNIIILFEVFLNESFYTIKDCEYSNSLFGKLSTFLKV